MHICTYTHSTCTGMCMHILTLSGSERKSSDQMCTEPSSLSDCLQKKGETNISYKVSTCVPNSHLRLPEPQLVSLPLCPIHRMSDTLFLKLFLLLPKKDTAVTCRALCVSITTCPYTSKCQLTSPPSWTVSTREKLFPFHFLHTAPDLSSPISVHLISLHVKKNPRQTNPKHGFYVLTFSSFTLSFCKVLLAPV